MRLAIKKKNYHHGDLKNSLVLAGLDLLKQVGVSGISLRAVAKSIGVSHTAPYRHFESKIDLLAAMAQKGFELLTQKSEAAIESEPDNPREQLIVASEAYVEMAVDNPKLMHLMFGGVVSPAEYSESYYEVAQNSFRSLMRIIDNGQKQNLYREKPIADMAVIVWSLVHGLAMLISAGQLGKQLTTQQQISALSRSSIESLLDGIMIPVR